MGFGHVADEPAQGQRQFLDQSRRGDDLLALGERGVLGNIHHVEVVAPIEVLLEILRMFAMARVEFGVEPVT